MEQGATKVVCTINGPQEPERGHTKVDQVYLTVTINVAPFSSIDRRKRMRNDRRIQELQTVVQQTFQEAILGHLHPRTEIIISLNVLAQDGGFFAACINATSLALVDAGIPLYDYVSACSCALYDTTPLLDPNHSEESDLSSMTVALVGKSHSVSTMLLEERIALDRLEAILTISIAGCHSLRDQMDSVVKKHGRRRLSMNI